MHIPFVDLKTQYALHRTELDAAMQSVIDDAAFIRGKHVKAFEEAYAEAYGVRHCISCGNGTDAIYIALKMLGLGPGDEVITVANSWIATSEAISETGAQVVFADIEPDLYTIDPARVETLITERTRAILPVHLFGLPADMEPLVQLCEKHNLLMVEDCAQAHFATYRGRRVGTFGAAGTFSFYPGKNLGAYGDAGCVITDDDDLAAKCRMFANHGALVKGEHAIEGINSRLDGLQAAVLNVKLPHIHDWNALRHQHGVRYTEQLQGIGDLELPVLRSDSDHIFHIYCVRTGRRDELRAWLQEKGVPTVLHYPTPLPFLGAYADLGHGREDFPVAAAYQSRIVSLPMFPEMTDEQIDYVSDCIRGFFER